MLVIFYPHFRRPNVLNDPSEKEKMSVKKTKRLVYKSTTVDPILMLFNQSIAFTGTRVARCTCSQNCQSNDATPMGRKAAS